MQSAAPFDGASLPPASCDVRWCACQFPSVRREPQRSQRPLARRKISSRASSEKAIASPFAEPFDAVYPLGYSSLYHAEQEADSARHRLPVPVSESRLLQQSDTPLLSEEMGQLAHLLSFIRVMLPQ